MRVSPPTIVLLLLAAASAEAAPRVAILAPGDPLDRVLLRELSAIVSRSGARPLAPAEAASRLEADPGLASARQRASSLLERATELARNVRYDEALAALRTAETAAERGLAAVVEPRMLSELYLQRGLALLATDAAEAQRWLESSFQHWPGRPLDASVHAPRILQALRAAARTARVEGARELAEADLGRAARILGVQTILLVRAGGERGRLSVRRFDSRPEAYAGTTEVEWTADASPAQAREALRGLLLWFPRAGEDGGAPRTRVSPLTWVLLGVAGAATVTGIGLAAQAQVRFDDAGALANRTPKLEEYAPAARDAEDAGRALRTGAIVSFSLGAAAAVAAVVVWQRTKARREPAVRVGLAPAGLRLRY